MVVGAALVVSTIVAIFTPGSALAWTAPPKPTTVHSYYVENTELSYWKAKGEQAAEETIGEFGMVILDFGGQLGNRSGTETNNRITVTNAKIEAIAEEFAFGFYNAQVDGLLYLDVGTNNSKYSVSKSGGKAWAEVVKHVANYVLENPPLGKYISVYGGDDVETGPAHEGWSSAGKALDWAKSYSETTESPYVDYGDAGACPKTYYEKNSKGGACETEDPPGGWDQRAEYELAWEINRAHGAPQIYYPPPSNNAGQWAEIGLYGQYLFGGGIQFEGPLDQDGADDSNYAGEAWKEFEEALHGSSLNESMAFSLQI